MEQKNVVSKLVWIKINKKSSEREIHNEKIVVFILFILHAMTFSKNLIVKDGETISSRFLVPSEYEREYYPEDSFGTYLRSLKLKEMGAPVLLYDGREKFVQSYISVIDMPILPQDLIQCADALIKLRAEYLYSQKNMMKYLLI